MRDFTFILTKIIVFNKPRKVRNAWTHNIVKKSYLKNVDHVQEQGVSRRKSGAYTAVCEHFEKTHNAAIGR